MKCLAIIIEYDVKLKSDSENGGLENGNEKN